MLKNTMTFKYTSTNNDNYGWKEILINIYLYKHRTSDSLRQFS